MKRIFGAGLNLWEAGMGLILTLAPLYFYHKVFSRYFPNAHGALGLDYSYFFPRLLDGYFWRKTNGLWEVPWNTPSFCGGLPSFGNPQGMYYSLPQLLMLFTGPLQAVYGTFLIFLFLGFAGFYLLARRVFGISAPLSYLGAVLFMGNGFYAYNMIIGHFAFHAYQLIPLACYFLLRPMPDGGAEFWRRLILDSILAGSVLAVMIYSGMLVLGAPAAFSIIMTGGAAELFAGGEKRFWSRLALAGAIGLTLGAARLYAAISFMDQFGRDYYDFPGGIRPAAKLFWLAIQTIYFWPEKMLIYGAPFTIGSRRFVHSVVYYEYSVTIVPLLLGMISSYIAVKGISRRGWPSGFGLRTAFNTAVAASITALILLLNYSFEDPEVGEFLKTIPVIGAYSNFVTWLCAFLPAAILIPLAMFSRLELGYRAGWCVSLGGLAIAAGQILSHDVSFYEDQHYNPGVIQTAWEKAEKGALTPKVERIVDQSATNKEHALKIFPLGGDDYLASGGSQMDCYEPIFGYANLMFPWKGIRPGHPLEERDGRLNVKNPSCYSYPKENSCLPGDHFKTEQKAMAEEFLNYKPFAFQAPLRQRLANWATLASLALSAAFLAGYAFGVLRGRFSASAAEKKETILHE